MLPAGLPESGSTSISRSAALGSRQQLGQQQTETQGEPTSCTEDEGQGPMGGGEMGGDEVA